MWRCPAHVATIITYNSCRSKNSERDEGCFNWHASGLAPTGLHFEAKEKQGAGCPQPSRRSSFKWSILHSLFIQLYIGRVSILLLFDYQIQSWDLEKKETNKKWLNSIATLGRAWNEKKRERDRIVVLRRCWASCVQFIVWGRWGIDWTTCFVSVLFFPVPGGPD